MKKLFLFTLGLLLMGSFVPFAEPAENLPTVSWRMQMAFPAGKAVDYKNVRLENAPARYLKVLQKVSERTEGKFKITAYEPGVLFKPSEYYEAVRSGAVEMIIGYGWYYSGQIPAGFMDPGIFFMTSSGKEFLPISVESDWLKVLREAYAEHNIYYLDHSASGGKSLLTNFPVNSVADLKGKKMRGSGPEAEMLKLFGAKPTFVDPAETYVALQRGTIDGIAYSVSVSAMTGWMEVYKYCIVPCYFDPNIVNVCVNMDVWNKLPKAYKDILTEESRKAAKHSFEVVNDLMDEWALTVAAPKYGVKIIELSKEAYEEMRKIQLPMWEKYASEDKHCARLLEIVKKAVK